MKTDDFISYLASTGELDEFLGLERKVMNCPNCGEELYIYEKYLLYCKKCKYMLEHKKDERLDNKKLTYIEKQSIGR